VARQLRLRDIAAHRGGFHRHGDALEPRQVLQSCACTRPATGHATRAFAVSELGLIEMTGRGFRPSLWQSMATECPRDGKGPCLPPRSGRPSHGASLSAPVPANRSVSSPCGCPEVALYLVGQGA